MDFAFSYIISRFFYRIAEFLRHWYVVGTYRYADFVMGVLRRMDRTLAWRITLNYLFKPLYGDYSALGYVMGFVFRLFRLFVGGVVYIIAFVAALFVYVLWLLFPAYLVAKLFF